MEFFYELENTEQLTEEQIGQIEKALGMSAYVCQQEFEKALALYHEINVIMDADGEAFVSSIEFDGDDVYVVLDCRDVVVRYEIE